MVDFFCGEMLLLPKRTREEEKLGTSTAELFTQWLLVGRRELRD